MEFTSRPSTTPAQSHQPTAVSAFDPDSSPDLPHQYYLSPVRERASYNVPTTYTQENMTAASPNGPAAMAYGQSRSVSPRTSREPKNLTFELLFNEALQTRARLPLRVNIYPHDTTDSIVTTVKNFYGLYSRPHVPMGVSFEDDQGTTLIARYENFHDNMTVFVRVFSEEMSPVPAVFGHAFHPPPVGAQAFYGDGYSMQAPPQPYGPPVSRPASRTSRVRSPSPNSGRGRRSTSAGTNSKKGRSRSAKNRASGSQADVNGYSSEDGAPGSASGKYKDPLGNTEISVENIVEGGRRKRAKFESSVSARTGEAMVDWPFQANKLSLRNSRSLLRRRCPRLLRIRPFRRPDVWNTTATHYPLSTPGKIRLATPGPCNRHKAIQTAMPTLRCILLR